ncbi:MAG TPA: biopolymer transporter ExbD [Verrucomicrobiae bacterium]|jgi:biopolymer transport protein ExbD|nr:biopolymer transporter ExbD [Verrucomicrobiae bacterium]
MRIRRPAEASEPTIQVINLVDVLFVLVLFLLVATTFSSEERDLQVNLPSTAEGKTLSDAAPLITINVRQDGSYFLADRTMDLAQLRQAVADTIRAKPDQKVLVRGDKLALHGYVAAAVLACRESGVQQANIGYQLQTAATGK